MSKGKFAIGALFGAAVGAVAALLTAPKSGKETREDIKRKAGELKSEAANKADDVRKKADDVRKDVESKAKDLGSRAENTIQGAKDGFNKKV